MDMETERALTCMIAVVSNMSCVPLAVSCTRRGLPYETIVGTCCALCSLMYHVGEIYPNHPLYMASGLTAGQWHRLDNVFSILSFSALLFFLMDIRSTKIAESLRWMSVAMTLYCQEKAPWDIAYTAMPISVPLVMLVGHCVHQKVTTGRAPQFLASRQFAMGMGSMVIAIVCFVRGLDDHNDWLRMWHGMWHLWVGVGFYHLFHARAVGPKVHQSPAHMSLPYKYS